MRPGVLFVGLFLVLALLYQLLAPSLDDGWIIAIQGGIVGALLTAASWWRRRVRKGRGPLPTDDQNPIR